MKSTIAAFLILAAHPTAAFDVEATIQTLDDANYACFAGENHDGEAISEDAIKRACAQTAELLKTLHANGYCHDPNDMQWWRCK